jgi:hypothetical protein
MSAAMIEKRPMGGLNFSAKLFGGQRGKCFRVFCVAGLMDDIGMMNYKMHSASP